MLEPEWVLQLKLKTWFDGPLGKDFTSFNGGLGRLRVHAGQFKTTPPNLTPNGVFSREKF